MTHTEQQRLIRQLADYTHKMKRYDQEEFEMFLKRDKDDEYLDEQSQRRLVDLYKLYVPPMRQLL